MYVFRYYYFREKREKELSNTSVFDDGMKSALEIEVKDKYDYINEAYENKHDNEPPPYTEDTQNKTIYSITRF